MTRGKNTEYAVWDNSNIAESYSGIVLPLTCSFARIIYSQVYKDLARTSGVSLVKIKEHAEVFENLLGFFYGRFYYNRLNWYRMLTLFPGYGRNKANLDDMITATFKAELDNRHKINVSFWFKVKYYLLNAYRIIMFEKSLSQFKKHIKRYFSKIKEYDFEKKSAKELIDLYYEFKKELLVRWSITVDNDFLAMTCFGAFKKLCKRRGIEGSAILQMLVDMRNVISANQVAALRKLSREFRKHDLLIDLARQERYSICYEKITKDRNYAHLSTLIKDYFTVYGGRFANELKLEADDLDSKPEYIIKILFLYTMDSLSNQDKVSNKKIIENISKKNILIRFFLGTTKHYLRHREELRLLRSQAFSHTRKIFKNIGEKFKADGIIDKSADIFYLEVSEIENFLEGTAITSDLRSLVDIRKKEYAEFYTLELPSVFITCGNPYMSLKSVKNSTAHKHNRLKGDGCSYGIVSGKVTILDSFNLPDNEGYEIIVTKHTDPGWTPLFGLCKGIIVEHGGLLSHASIVSRELGLPCIIGVSNATTILKDGQRITMNASTGEIKIEE